MFIHNKDKMISITWPRFFYVDRSINMYFLRILLSVSMRLFYCYLGVTIKGSLFSDIDKLRLCVYVCVSVFE